jgi:uncharacterized repeat protein (TIGR01451 family)
MTLTWRARNPSRRAAWLRRHGRPWSGRERASARSKPSRPSSVDALPEINLEKVVDETTEQPAAYAGGDTVRYKFIVTNTSPYTITNAVVTDPSADTPPGITCPEGQPFTLAPAGTHGSSITCTGQHTITSASAHSTTFNNAAEVTGMANGAEVNDDASATVPLASTPGIKIEKTATINGAPAPPAVASLGDTIVYSYTVTNIGNETIHNVQVIDTKVGTFSCGNGALPAGNDVTCTGPSYTVTQADIDAGHVFNSAVATGYTNPRMVLVNSDPDTVDIPTENRLGLELEKTGEVTGTGPNGAVVAGDVVDYTFKITNTGDVTL